MTTVDCSHLWRNSFFRKKKLDIVKHLFVFTKLEQGDIRNHLPLIGNFISFYSQLFLFFLEFKINSLSYCILIVTNQRLLLAVGNDFFGNVEIFSSVRCYVQANVFYENCYSAETVGGAFWPVYGTPIRRISASSCLRLFRDFIKSVQVCTVRFVLFFLFFLQ